MQKRLERLDVELVAVIHDELIVQTPHPWPDKVRGIVEQAMIDGMQTFVRGSRSLLRLMWGGVRRSLSLIKISNQKVVFILKNSNLSSSYHPGQQNDFLIFD